MRPLHCAESVLCLEHSLLLLLLAVMTGTLLAKPPRTFFVIFLNLCVSCRLGLGRRLGRRLGPRLGPRLGLRLGLRLGQVDAPCSKRVNACTYSSPS